MRTAIKTTIMLRNEIHENYDPYSKIFYCFVCKCWRRHSACKWRATVRIDDCSTHCKQAISENVFVVRAIRNSKIKIKRVRR